MYIPVIPLRVAAGNHSETCALWKPNKVQVTSLQTPILLPQSKSRQK